MDGGKKISILITDDHAVFRRSLRTIIDGQADMVVVAEAENGVEALKQVNRHHPDIVLMDIHMPEMDGIDTTRSIKAVFGDTKIIALSSYTEDFYVQKMINAGAAGYLSKGCSREDLLDYIRSVWQTTTASKSKPTDEG